MTTREVLSNYYELVMSKECGKKVLNVYKGKDMCSLPASFLYDYANPETICPNHPVRGMKFSTGNPDYGDWDAQIVKVIHGYVVDVYVCAILVRPFSKEAYDKYGSMMGMCAQKRAALLWDSREYDKVHGYVPESEKNVVKAKRKRVRPTLAQVRALERENAELRDSVSKLEEKLECVKRAADSLSEFNDQYKKRINELESRGFWARVFNK